MKAVQQGSNGLDKLLATEQFADKDAVSRSIKRRLQKSPLTGTDGNELVLEGKELEEATQYWTTKVSTCLDEFRTASAKHTEKLVQTSDTTGAVREWKLKDETDAYRVMYREGEEGTPFHTLCLDGVVNGDFTTALCVAWESPMFKEWWPQFHLPAFKITESRWLRRIRVGEDLSLIRFKLPWPMAPREVLISALELEYFEDELLICLIESVPENVELKEKLHGFSAADLPPPSSHVRMVVNGGFAMQKLSDNQFFFRTIVNMDMKLDLVPPTFINFVSRQVAGQGLKLYQKAVLAACNNTGSGKQYQDALQKGLLYKRVKAGLEAKTLAREDSLQMSRPGEKLGPALKETVKTKTLPGSIRRMGSSDSTSRIVPLPVKADHGDMDDIRNEVVDPVGSCVQHPVEPVHERGHLVKAESPTDSKSNVLDAVAPPTDEGQSERNVREYDDPEVEWALSTLNKMINFTRSRAAGGAGALDSHATEREGIRLSGKRLNSESSSKEKQTCDLALGERLSTPDDKFDVEEIRRSTQPQLLSGEIESSTASSLWSKSENEIVSSQDDSDSETGASGNLNSVAGQITTDESKTDIAHGHRKKWPWTSLFSSVPWDGMRAAHWRTTRPAFLGRD